MSKNVIFYESIFPYNFSIHHSKNSDNLIHDDVNFLLKPISCSGSTKAHDPGNIVHVQDYDNTPEITHSVDSVSEITNCVDNVTRNNSFNNVDSDSNISAEDFDIVIRNGLGSDLRRSRRIKKTASYLVDYHHQVVNTHKDSNSNFKIKYHISSVLT